MTDGLYKHFEDATLAGVWDAVRWPDFSPAEENIHCPCCGEFYLDPSMFDRLQYARARIGKAFRINSGHRCRRHNSAVGGREYSQHLRLAFDISTRGHDKFKLLNALKAAGFTTFGFYSTFIHTDSRNGRIWYSKNGRAIWLKQQR